MSARTAPARRALLVAAMLLLVAGCHRVQRCATCGMKIDPASPWASYVTIGDHEDAFDTPTCAFIAWRKAGTPGHPARFREYYSQAWTPAVELRFVRGSDVTGPMGPDLVPVSTDAANRFARDHNGAPPASVEELLQGETP